MADAPGIRGVGGRRREGREAGSAPEGGSAEGAEMSFLDHLDELRGRLIWSLAALVAASVIGFFVVTELNVIGILERPIRGLIPGDRLLFTSPTTPIVVTFKLAFVVGIILALPVILYHAWAFFSPALHDHEKRYVIPALWTAFGLFLAGLAMAYFLVLPLGLQFLLGFQAGALEPLITVDEYLSFATRILLIFGLIFEMPVVLVLLCLMGVVTPDGLARYRKHALVGSALAASLLTPADLGTMMLLMVPMVILYEASIWLSRLVLRASRRRAPREEVGAEGVAS